MDRDRFEDCSVCQERYWGEDIRKYMKEGPSGDWYCFYHQSSKIPGAEPEYLLTMRRVEKGSVTTDIVPARQVYKRTKEWLEKHKSGEVAITLCTEGAG